MTKQTTPGVIADEFERYQDRDVIPLHKRGKRPLHNGWTRKRYTARKVIAKCAAEGFNMGLRLGPCDIAFDVDPRHGGDKSFARFCADTGLNPDKLPRVDTGSGGQHLFGTLPQSVRIVGSLKDYPGLEFKTAGQQVVCAGSVHPETGKPYRWNDLFPEVAPPCPAAVVEAIKRPAVDFKATGGGQHTPDEIEAMLSALDPADFRDEQKWRELMMAVHHASAGDAREVFMDWSRSDEGYTGDTSNIGPRWELVAFGKARRGHGRDVLQVVSRRRPGRLDSGARSGGRLRRRAD